MAKLSFYGASGGIVTGSCHMLDTEENKYLVDCGLFQGSRKICKLNWEGFGFDPKEIKAVFLTHAHLDHVGRLPLLVKNGFRGKIFCTDATRDLVKIVLLDALKLHKEAVKKGHDRCGDIQEIQYTEEHIEQALNLMEVVDYGKMYDFNELKFRLRDAGHILGSAIYEIWFPLNNGRMRKIVFSGDLGQPGQRIIRDPEYIREADYLVVESTYGGRTHPDKASTILEFITILKHIAKYRGVGLIPVFAIERAQEILYELNLLAERQVLDDPNIAFYLDSPMASEVTRIFEMYRKYYDEDALLLVKKGDQPFRFRNLRFVSSTAESKKLRNVRKSVIMAGSGMITGGRIIHHIKNHGSDPNNHIVFVGYQVPGTIGRMILDGKRKIRIAGKDVFINAKVHYLQGFSSHADQVDLLYWIRNFGRGLRNIFLIHGENDQREVLAQKIYLDLQVNPVLPLLGETVYLD